MLTLLICYSISDDITLRNNAMLSTMVSLGLSSSIISTIVDDPSFLAHPGTEINISSSDAQLILSKGYTAGFQHLFFLNASLAGLATVVSLTMIKHKELTRDDEEKYKKEGLAAFEAEKARHNCGSKTPGNIETGNMTGKESKVGSL